MKHYKDKSVMVFGLGRSGLSAARVLIENGARVFAWDDGEAARDQAGAEGIPLEPPENLDWKTIRSLILSPGIPHTYPSPHPVAVLAREAGVPIFCDIDLFATAAQGVPIVGVTGTNGKSTTTSLIGHILSQAGRSAEVGGNIGAPVLELAPLDSEGVYVVELSSYQLERSPHLGADIGVLLNVSPDHLDRHGGMKGYVWAKSLLFASQKKQTGILSVDDKFSREVYETLSAVPSKTLIPISIEQTLSQGLFVEGDALVDTVWSGGARVFDFTMVPPCLQGPHNRQNLLAAYGVVRTLGLAAEQFAEGVKTFKGLSHRMEVLGVFDGVTVINDSKGTNGMATAKALETFENIHWILGGVSKESGLEGLEAYDARISKAYLIGASSDAFAKALEGRLPYQACEVLERAVPLALENAKREAREKGAAVVLLSPACASFDQFKNFEARGDTFRELVRTTELFTAGSG